MPSPNEHDSIGIGCMAALLLYLAVCAGLFWTGGSLRWIVFAAPALLILATVAWKELEGRSLVARADRDLAFKGIRCIVVSSDSPNWNEYIRDTWIARLGERASVLNWSERKRWPSTIAVELFRHFALFGGRNFNPCVLVLRGPKKPGIYRFYYAFQQAKHGRTQYRDALEKRMFEEIDHLASANTL